MKKIIFSLSLVLYYALGFSQLLFENFENTTGPDAAPSTNWTLGSGNWAVFDNNVGGTTNWSINPNSYSGSIAAYMNRQNIGQGITTEEYLATPMVTVPANGKLEFYSRSFTAGNQGTLYQVKVASASNAQNLPASYTILLEEFGEDQISPAFSLYWKKTFDLSGFAGQNIYIAFVKKYTQPTGAITGDRWLLDDVSVTAGTDCDSPANFSVNYSSSSSSYTLTWNADTASSWEVLAIPCTQQIPLAGQSGTVTSSNSYNFTGLTETCYNFCVRRICSNGTFSYWSITSIYIPVPPPSYYVKNVVSFIDNNSNGVRDSGDSNFYFGTFSFEMNNSGVVQYSEPTNGYKAYHRSATNIADFGCQIMSDYAPFYSLSTSYCNDVPFTSSETLYFPVTVIQPYDDLSTYIYSNQNPRAGSNYKLTITYRNNGSTPNSGTINFVKDSSVSIANVSLSGITPNANGFSYQTSTLAPGQGGVIIVTLSIPQIPNVTIGDLLNNTVNITSNSGNDALPSNNSFSDIKTILAGYDPNNKTESHGGQIQFDEFTSDDYLYYTINFQNLGNASAIDVRIEDVLDSKIDESTIQMVESSHNYTMERTGGGLTWRFNNIQLLPAFVSEELSKGFVFFKVKPKPGYAVGDIIPNTAEIYFDSNPAIVTNTFNTEFVQALGTTNFEWNNFVIFPNPTIENVTISLQNTSEMIDSITITDVLGKTIRNIKGVSGNQFNMDVSDVSQGVYFVEIITQNNEKKVKKLIKK